MSQKAAVFGSTGLVGSAIVDALKKHQSIDKIYCYGRKPPMFMEGKTTEFKPFETDNFRMPEDADLVFCALGTTIKKAGSRQDFQEVDLYAVQRIAEKSKEYGIRHLIVISSVGADMDSKNFYLRTKGQMEEAVKQAGIEHTVIVRPSLLLGKRDEKRPAESLGKFLMAPLGFLMAGPLKKYRPIQARQVARTMIAESLKDEKGFKILENQNLF